MAYRVLSRDEHFSAPGPKRILALDGGGLRGVVTLGYLQRIETLLRARHGGDPAFRLCHYFDLIAGTSTGAIIAAALALGMTVDDVLGHYERLGREVFRGDWWRASGLVVARYDAALLAEHLKRVLGANRTLGDGGIGTGLLIVTKRLDSGSVWPLGNNPRGQYFKAPEGQAWISNGEYPLWQIVRASTAAPTFFDPEPVTIATTDGRVVQTGRFVDGGVSPHNNPALQAFMYATLDGFRVNWPTGADAMLLTSVGTGAADPRKTASRLAAKEGIAALNSLMDDCGALVETLLQWMSSSRTARIIDGELGDLSHDLVAGAPLLSYLRYNLLLTEGAVRALLPGLPDDVVRTLPDMDRPEHLHALLTLGQSAAEEQVLVSDFPTRFDLA
jgi:uncharacterized protein